MSNLYEALHPKQKQFYNEERRKFIAKKRLPVLLRQEKEWQDDVDSEWQVKNILATKKIVEKGVCDKTLLVGALELRDCSINCLFEAMQMVVTCEQIIQR
jgi:hypothetical protein